MPHNDEQGAAGVSKQRAEMGTGLMSEAGSFGIPILHTVSDGQ